MDFSSLNGFDYIALAIIALSALIGLTRGFIQTIMSFVAWIGSIFVALYLFPYVQPIIAESISSEIVANSLTFIGIYLASLVFFILLGFQLLLIAEALRFGPVDRSLGLAFGIVRGVVLVTVIFIGITFFLSLFGMHDSNEEVNKQKTPDWLADAQTYNMLQVSASTAMGMVPDDVFDRVKDFAESFDSPLKQDEWKPSPAMVGALRDMAGALPDDVRKDIFRKYQKASQQAEGRQVSPQVQFEFSKDLVKAYFEQVREGKVVPKENISPEVLNKLEKVFDEVSPSIDQVMKATKDMPHSTRDNAKQMKDLEALIKDFE